MGANRSKKAAKSEASQVPADSAKAAIEFTTTGAPPVLSLRRLGDVEKAAQDEAVREELSRLSQVVVVDWSRIGRRSRELMRTHAKKMLTDLQLREYAEWEHATDQMRPLRGLDRMQQCFDRLAPEGNWQDGRFKAVLTKHAGIPLNDVGELPLDAFAKVLDVAAESVEAQAYPGSSQARIRYALAFKRFAREIADAGEARWSEDSGRAAGLAEDSAIRTLILALNDGSLAELWSSAQELVDSTGLTIDGKSQPHNEVSNSGWLYIWRFPVISRLMHERSSFFEGLTGWRAVQSDQEGHPLDEEGKALKWIWDGYGSGMLERPAAEEPSATEATLSNQDRSSASACNALAEMVAPNTPGGSWTSMTKPPVPKRINWGGLTADDFERLLFLLFSCTDAYEHTEWLMKTRAPDGGRDISTWRVVRDPLVGPSRLRVVVQCKHWLSKSVAPEEIMNVGGQMKLWEPPRVDEVIVASSGRFTQDAVKWAAKHNEDGIRPRVVLWAESHLESLLASRADLLRGVV